MLISGILSMWSRPADWQIRPLTVKVIKTIRTQAGQTH